VNRITFADEALEDLDSIYRYIAEDNMVAADRHREQLRRRWEQLVVQPRMGRVRDDLKPGYRSITEGEYVIFYRIVSEQQVQVMRVLPKTMFSSASIPEPGK
jgi:toxin ParE1/3/4